ncbi:MAG: hypothetical protein AB7F86_08230 [Bdellovibrionales bacterium]
MNRLLLITLTLFGSVGFALPKMNSPLSTQEIQEMVIQFQLGQLTKATASHNPNCDDQPGSPSCVEVLCQSTNCYGSTGQEIARACAGSSGRCVQTLCQPTNCYGSTGRDIAQACRGSSGLCVEVLCQSTNCYGSTGRDIAQACVGSDGRCVETLCKSTNCYGSTGRDIARSCAGN